jgi:hypothetical protein
LEKILLIKISSQLQIKLARDKKITVKLFNDNNIESSQKPVPMFIELAGGNLSDNLVLVVGVQVLWIVLKTTNPN